MAGGLNVSPQKTANYITPLILLHRINPLLTSQSFHRATNRARGLLRKRDGETELGAVEKTFLGDSAQNLSNEVLDDII